MYLRFLIDRGGLQRYDGDPHWKTPKRAERLEYELGVIEEAGFSSTFVMLWDVMEFCRREKIPVGPGRGSVGGSYACYCAGIHDVDSIEWGLLFERFMNPMRVTAPDVDVDVSQRHRPRVLQYIMDKYTRDDQVVLQIGAFVRAGGRAVVDLMAGAMAQHDQNAWATATNLKKCFPDTGSITGGQKIARELNAWLYEGAGHGDKARFIEIATQAGWLDTLLKLDGMFTHLGKHAAGVVILRKEDLPILPKLEVRNTQGESAIVTAYDMYTLDALGYLKWDWLGLRTLDVISDADIWEGGTGERDDLIRTWRENMDHPGPYEIIAEGDTLGLFQIDTDGYRRTCRNFGPEDFNHLVQLVALYRPGAIDFKREDGKNMVDVFIDRRHGREPVTYDHPLLEPILRDTYGVILYQEQQMAIARAMGGFTLAQADALRKAIGKKRADEMAKLKPMFFEGAEANGVEPAVIERVWTNIEAAARYSWNKSHAVEYAIILWQSAWFKWLRVGFYCAEINSWQDKKDRQANVVAKARQHVTFRPPDVNIAEDSFIVKEREIVFGLNGIKGMGDSYRNAILIERELMGGPFSSFQEFCYRLPSLPMNMKLALIKCGAFDQIEDRRHLLATIPKAGRRPPCETCDGTGEVGDLEVMPCPDCDGEGLKPAKRWSVAEHLNHNRNLKKPRELPEDEDAYEYPSDAEIAAGEMESMGYYISDVPMKEITKSLARHNTNVIGGEIEKVDEKTDKKGGLYGHMVVITPDLNKQRVIIFASNWPQNEMRCEKGKQLLFQGRKDGDVFLADKCWEPNDVRQFKKVKLQRGDEKATTAPFDGQLATLTALESAGYRVRLF